jgi:Bacterial regulatory proteins, tetR family
VTYASAGVIGKVRSPGSLCRLLAMVNVVGSACALADDPIMKTRTSHPPGTALDGGARRTGARGVHGRPRSGRRPFADNDYRATIVELLAERVNVTSQALYYNFENMVVLPTRKALGVGSRPSLLDATRGA